MDYRDVHATDWKTSRHIDPLKPSYTIRDEDNNLTTIGPIQGSLSQALPPERKEVNFTSLKTSDIIGCASGSMWLGNFHSRQRRSWLTSNVIKDIPGAQPSTVKKSPQTNRCLNPLSPQYKMPGETELIDPNDYYSKSKAEKMNRSSRLKTHKASLDLKKQ